VLKEFTDIRFPGLFLGVDRKLDGSTHLIIDDGCGESHSITISERDAHELGEILLLAGKGEDVR